MSANPPSEQVVGAYRLLAPIGEGATGTVWRAEHTPTGDHVALKVLREELESTESVGRFAREARLAAQLVSPQIVRVEDAGTCDDGRPFVVMELLEGELLATRLKRESRLGLAAVLPIVQQLAEALDLAHKQKIVHRDVKPENVFLERAPGSRAVRVKLMDFGIAKEFDVPDAPPASAQPPSKVALQRQLTRVGDVVGTPSYMSPEQATARPLDHRTDLWGLGVTVYRLVTGELPFGTGPQAAVAYRIMTATPKKPTELAPDLPATIDAWMEKALAKAPNDRFANAREMAEELAQVAMSSATSMPPIAREAPPSTSASTDELAPVPTSSFRAPLVIGLVVALLIVVGRLLLG